MTITNPLAHYKWENRVLLIFADDQEKITEQMNKLKDHKRGFDDRDLVIFEFHNKRGKAPNNIVLKAEQVNWFYENYNRHGEEFKVILIGKDGTVKLEQESYLPTDKLFSTIDAMPMRKREMKDDLR